MMKQGIVLVTFDAPDTPEFLAWAHERHMKDAAKVPGVQRVRRYEVIDGPPDRRRYLSISEYQDLQAALAVRNSDAGRLPQQDANRQGVTNLYTLACTEICSQVFVGPTDDCPTSTSES